tara:strand:- start:246 stop:1952 length:1707 start_codon:yes stop_codon:yes gene_type:complete
MQYQDFMLSGMIFSAINNVLENLKTGVLYLDILITLSIIILMNLFSDIKNAKETINKFIRYLIPDSKKENMILFISKKGACSQVFRSLLFYLAKDPDNKNICNLIEDVNSKYNRWGDYHDDEGIKTLYRVNQQEDFKFNEKICGRIYTEEKESGEHNGKVKYEEMVNLEVFSNKITMEELQLFIEECHESYKKNLKEKLILNQSIITIESDIKKSSEDESDYLNIKKKEWLSFKTFNNTFFPGKDNVIKKIEFFVKNKDWYEKKGLPWTLGIMLSGVPGSGKTSFIKALMNFTGRHCVNVKLDDDFKMNELEQILADEEIDSDIIIPIDKRIVVLEDIDCMGDIVKDRDLREEEDQDNLLNKKLLKAVSDNSSAAIPISAAELLKRDSKFNLSKLLNIIDGLDEHPGRILVITTNKPEKLDKALVRPGRIDIRLHFENAVEDDIHNIINHFWEIDENERLQPLSKFDYVYSPAAIINFCRMSNSYDETIELLENNLLKQQDGQQLVSNQSVEEIIAIDNLLFGHNNMIFDEVSNVLDEILEKIISKNFDVHPNLEFVEDGEVKKIIVN